MVNLAEARMMAAAARRAMLLKKPASVKTAMVFAAIVRLDEELRRIGNAVEEHDEKCPFFKSCCKAAVKPLVPPTPIIQNVYHPEAKA